MYIIDIHAFILAYWIFQQLQIIGINREGWLIPKEGP